MEEKRRQLLEAKIMELKAKVDKIIPFEDKFFNERRVSDLKVNVGDKTFYVSKHQLVKKSVVFETMFLSHLKEAEEGVWNLTDDDPKAVEAMLKYIYMNTKIKNFELARNVVPLAHRYDLQDLKNECELVLLEKVSLESAEEAFCLAKKLDLNLLLIKSCQIIYCGSHLEEPEGAVVQPDDNEGTELPSFFLKNSAEFYIPKIFIHFNQTQSPGVFKLLISNRRSDGFYLFEPCDKLSNNLITVECNLHERDGCGNRHILRGGKRIKLTIRKRRRYSSKKHGVLVWNYVDENLQKDCLRTRIFL